MNGKGSEFLDFSFKKLKEQTFKDFEVVISDHSSSDDIKNLCNLWTNNLNIRYFKNDKGRGSSSANINNAIKNSSGEWIKILFQDDFLYDERSLQNMFEATKHESSPTWIASACEHSNDGINFYRPFYPTWNHNIQYGMNTISSPSVLLFKKSVNKLFNEELIWLMDVDFYRRMYDEYGEPLYLYDICVVNRTWENSVSNNVSEERKQRELDIMLKTYDQKEILFKAICDLKFDQKILYGRGIVDINEHLPTLRRYASQCKHVTEMGTRFAVSTYALIIAKPEKVVSIDLNRHFFSPYEKEIREFSNACGTNFVFKEEDVLKIEIEETDLLFIDTLHTYNQLSKELRKHQKNVRKWIVLHDTVTFGRKDEDFYQNGKISSEVSGETITKRGLYTALEDFLEENKSWKIKEHFTNNNGLTVLERIDD